MNFPSLEFFFLQIRSRASLERARVFMGIKCIGIHTLPDVKVWVGFVHFIKNSCVSHFLIL